MLELLKLDFFRLLRPLANPFVTSFAKREFISHVIVICQWKTKNNKTIISYGEATTHSEPYFNGEFDLTSIAYLGRALPHLLKKKYFNSPQELHSFLHEINFDKNNRFSIASLDIAFHDAFAKEIGLSLSQYLFNKYGLSTPPLTEVAIGTSIGISETVEELIKKVGFCLKKGIRKIKLKIKPKYDLEYIKAVKEKFRNPDFVLSVDANCSYDFDNPLHLLTLVEIAKLVDIIEQPFAFDDLANHAQFIKIIRKNNLKTLICLDENIRSPKDLNLFLNMIDNQKNFTLNIKLSRVGGLAPAIELFKTCQENNVLIMPGNMHEFTVGAAAIVSFSSLDKNFFPGDTEGEEKNYPNGAITNIMGKPFTGLLTNKNNKLTVPQMPGLGIGDIDFKKFKKVAPKCYVLQADHWTRRLLTKTAVIPSE